MSDPPRSGSLPRLSSQTLRALPHPASGRWSGPPPRPARTGIVHLGIGAFHRAHQAVFTEDAAVATGDDRWGICGVTQRSPRVLEQLAPQDGLYGLLERGQGAAPLRVVGVVREVRSAGADPDAVADLIADDDVHVVTLTVTEKGYRRAASGGLDLDDPGVRADLAGSRAGAKTTVGQLARGLQRRLHRGGAPLTVLSCDNLSGNGPVLRALVGEFCAALPSTEAGPLGEWLASSVRFPATMVDRIVPASTEEDRELAGGVLGLRDEALVVAEPFRQWVIEDSFAGPRPAWERAGAHLVADVAPWEAAKLRLLNATHSTLAYLGALRGHPTIAGAMADDDLRQVAEALMEQDATPTLSVPPGLDVVAYRAQVLRRFADPALRHRTTQIAMDGSQKLPVRLLGIVRDRLAAGEQARWAALGVAAWMVYVARAAAGESASGPGGVALPLPLDDPLADRLRAAVRGATVLGVATPARLVEALLAVRPVFGDDLAADPTLCLLLIDQVTELSGVHRV